MAPLNNTSRERNTISGGDFLAPSSPDIQHWFWNVRILRIARMISCGIGYNKTNRRTIQIADGQLDAINPPYHLPNTCLSAISASRNGEFSSAFSGAIAPIRQAQPPLDLTHVFWEGTNRRPPRRLIQPLGIKGNAPLPNRAARWNHEIPSSRLGPSVPKRLRSPRSLIDAHS